MSVVKVRAKNAMECFGVARKMGEEFEMNQSDADAHVVAQLVEIVVPEKKQADEKGK